MKSLLWVALLAVAGYLGYQKLSANEIEGNWILDVDSMCKQLTDAGISEARVEAFRAKNSKGLTKVSISRSAMAITLMGEAIDLPYEVHSKSGSCSIVKLSNSPDVLKYCVNGSTLEVHNPKNKMIEVFKRN